MFFQNRFAFDSVDYDYKQVFNQTVTRHKLNYKFFYKYFNQNVKKAEFL